MADITKCANEDCKLIDCYRKTATDSFLQSYAKFEPNEKGVCNFYYKR